MKRILLVSAAIALVWASSASAMVTISKHNFTLAANAVRLNDPSVVSGEVCVFCHTPHGAAADAPLWNRKMATAGSYTPYMSSTLDAPGAAGGYDKAGRQPMGISLACLSCHDGTIAIDALRNAPGSGNYESTPTTRGFVFLGLAGGNVLNAGTITNLTQNLSSQHPISIEYPKYGAKNYDNAFNVPNATHSSGAMYFDEANLGKMDDNEVRLYVTNGTTDVFVECASCHNPHGTQNTGPGVDFPTFLRKSNNQSALCTTCHIK